MAKKSEKNDGYSTKSLSKQLDEASRLAEWSSAANVHRADFQSDVVTAVIAGYVDKFDALLPALIDAADGARDARTELVREASDMEGRAASVESQIDELKLRHVIGELDAEAFEAAQEEARADLDIESLDATRKSVTEIDALLEQFAQVQTTMDESRGTPAEARTASLDEEVLTASPGDEGLPAMAEAAPSLVGEGFSIEPTGLADIQPGDNGEVIDVQAEDNGEVIDVQAEADPLGDVWDVDMPGASPAAESAEPPVVAAEDGGDAADEPQEFMATGMVDVLPDIDLPPLDKVAEAPPGEGTRLVVSSPGAEPVVYPFNGEVMSLGRGRNNDVQIKNDGKISRYHCRIFRRGDEYVVEDNKSSNGTLVDGKLVTRQRLDGGEQVQVGETRVLFCAN
jgi:hypothetical protein